MSVAASDCSRSAAAGSVVATRFCRQCKIREWRGARLLAHGRRGSHTEPLERNGPLREPAGEHKLRGGDTHARRERDKLCLSRSRRELHARLNRFGRVSSGGAQPFTDLRWFASGNNLLCENQLYECPRRNGRVFRIVSGGYRQPPFAGGFAPRGYRRHRMECIRLDLERAGNWPEHLAESSWHKLDSHFDRISQFHIPRRGSHLEHHRIDPR